MKDALKRLQAEFGLNGPPKFSWYSYSLKSKTRMLAKLLGLGPAAEVTSRAAAVIPGCTSCHYRNLASREVTYPPLVGYFNFQGGYYTSGGGLIWDIESGFHPYDMVSFQTPGVAFTYSPYPAKPGMYIAVDGFKPVGGSVIYSLEDGSTTYEGGVGVPGGGVGLVNVR